MERGRDRGIGEQGKSGETGQSIAARDGGCGGCAFACGPLHVLEGCEGGLLGVEAVLLAHGIEPLEFLPQSCLRSDHLEFLERVPLDVLDGLRA